MFFFCFWQTQTECRSELCQIITLFGEKSLHNICYTHIYLYEYVFQFVSQLQQTRRAKACTNDVEEPGKIWEEEAVK